MLDPVLNFAKATLASGIASGATSLTVGSGEGTKFPQPSTDGAFNITIWNSTDYPDPSDDTAKEIVRCTARSTDTLTITRAQEGTTDVNHNTAGKTYKIVLSFTKKMKDDIDNLLEQSPTDLKISTASKGGVFNGGFELGTGTTSSSGWVGDEKYGVYTILLFGATGNISFDNTISHNGFQSLKIDKTNTSGGTQTLLGYLGGTGSSLDVSILSKYAIPVKSSTSYKLSFWVKATGITPVAQLQFYKATGVRSTNNSVTMGVINDWTYITTTLTTASDVVFAVLSLDGQSATVGTTWFDDIKLEEVVTDTTFTGKVAEKARLTAQAVTSTDNIDQSLDLAGAYANTYALTNAVNEGATHIQTFTPTKKYTTQIAVWTIAKGTGDWTLVVHTAGNVIVALKTIANASVTEGAMLYFDVPNIWTTGALHFHLYSSVADGTCKANTSNDLRTASFIQRYAKKTESFSLIANGIKTELKADKDGLLSNSIIDLDNGKYRYENQFNAVGNFNDIFSATAGGGSTTPDVVSGWDWANTAESLQSVGDTTARSVVFKVNTILPIKHLKLDVTMFNNNVLGGTFSISSDNVTYTTLKTLIQSASAQSEILETDLMNGLNVFYIKFAKSTENTYLRIDYLHILADLDTSSIPQGLLYPIGTNQFTETVKLPSVATRVYFRLNKFTNENGVVVPALEFTDASAVNIGYVPLKLDNSQETNPAVAIVKASTTNGQASGTGSDEGNNYILNDGEYMTLSTAVAELSVVYLVGKGTTAFTNITKNTFYLSSNGESNDATQDPSHQANFIIGARQQGLTDSVKNIGEEIEDVRKGIADNQELVRNNAFIIGFDAGTTDDYAITLSNFRGYKTGMSVIFRANTANTTGCTLNINGMGAKAIVKGVSTALSSNDILALMYCQCVYDGTNFVLLNPRAL